MNDRSCWRTSMQRAYRHTKRCAKRGNVWGQREVQITGARKDSGLVYHGSSLKKKPAQVVQLWKNTSSVLHLWNNGSKKEKQTPVKCRKIKPLQQVCWWWDLGCVCGLLSTDCNYSKCQSGWCVSSDCLKHQILKNMIHIIKTKQNKREKHIMLGFLTCKLFTYHEAQRSWETWECQGDMQPWEGGR